jgi:hypothetical protein
LHDAIRGEPELLYADAQGHAVPETGTGKTEPHAAVGDIEDECPSETHLSVCTFPVEIGV